MTELSNNPEDLFHIPVLPPDTFTTDVGFWYAFQRIYPGGDEALYNNLLSSYEKNRGFDGDAASYTFSGAAADWEGYLIVQQQVAEPGTSAHVSGKDLFEGFTLMGATSTVYLADANKILVKNLEELNEAAEITQQLVKNIGGLVTGFNAKGKTNSDSWDISLEKTSDFAYDLDNGTSELVSTPTGAQIGPTNPDYYKSVPNLAAAQKAIFALVGDAPNLGDENIPESLKAQIRILFTTSNKIPEGEVLSEWQEWQTGVLSEEAGTNLRTAFAAATNHSSVVQYQLKKALFTFNEFYKSAIDITQKLTKITTGMAQKMR